MFPLNKCLHLYLSCRLVYLPQSYVSEQDVMPLAEEHQHRTYTKHTFTLKQDPIWVCSCIIQINVNDFRNVDLWLSVLTLSPNSKRKQVKSNIYLHLYLLLKCNFDLLLCPLEVATEQLFRHHLREMNWNIFIVRICISYENWKFIQNMFLNL